MSKTRRKPKPQNVASPTTTPSSGAEPANRLPQGLAGPPISQTAIETAILALVRAMLPELKFFSRARCGFSSRKDAVSTYIRDERRLFRLQRDLHNLLLAALTSNVIGRSEGPDRHEARLEQAVIERICELLTQIPFRPEPIQSHLHVELTEEPLRHLVTILREDLERGLKTIATRFIKALERAIEYQLFGRIERVGRSGCRLLFFKDVIIQTGVTSTGAIAFDTIRFSPESGLREAEYHRQIRGVHEYRKALHSYELMDVKCYSFPGPEVPLPPQVSTLLDSIAPWLRPLIKYVTGTQIRARVLERDTVQKEWSETQVERVTYKGDPAITLFDYILTGWTDSEQKAAVRQQQLASQRRHSGQGFFDWLLSGK